MIDADMFVYRYFLSVIWYAQVSSSPVLDISLIPKGYINLKYSSDWIEPNSYRQLLAYTVPQILYDRHINEIVALGAN